MKFKEVDEAHHADHLCEISRKDMAKVDELSREPKFRCINCGRLANSEKSLCNPKSLDKNELVALAHDDANHSNHLCEMSKKHADIDALVADPKFRCANCGKVAHSEKNLCNPRKLK